MMEIISIIKICAVIIVPIMLLILFVDNIIKIKKAKKNKAPVKKSLIFWTIILGIFFGAILAFGIYLAVIFIGIASGAIKLM